MGEYTKLKIDGETLKLRKDSLEECKHFSDNIYDALQKYIYEENSWCYGIDSDKKKALILIVSIISATSVLSGIYSIPAIVFTIFRLYDVYPITYAILWIVGLLPLKTGISEIINELSIGKDERKRKKIFEENREKIEKVLEKHKQKLQEQEKTISKEKEEESNAETDTKVTTKVEHNEELIDAYIKSMENTSTSNDISHQYIK